jgi:hypothetical protein
LNFPALDGGVLRGILDGRSWGDPEVRANVGEIRQAALVSQLLAFSRKQVLQPRIIAVNDVVRGLAPMLRRLIPAMIRRGTRCRTGAC